MLGVVDYDSSDEGSDTEVQDEQTSALHRVSGGPKKITLPTVKSIPKPTKPVITADDDADAVPVKHDWENELAAQASIEKRNSIRKAKKISAFGTLFGKAVRTENNSDSDDEEREAKPTAPKQSFTSELLRILPPPKQKNPMPSSKAATVLLPNSIINKTRKRPLDAQIQQPKTAEIVERDVDSASEDESDDFFGLKTKAVAGPILGETDVPTAPDPRIYMDDVAPGPSRPPPKGESLLGESDVESQLLGSRNITDQQAAKLIYERELAPWGVTDQIARSAVMNMVDVSVDKTLGPNVRETLLRNLDQKVITAGALPQLTNTKDKLSKQKHQITHLGRLAVARESALQEKWAESRAKKKATAQKYGF